MKARMGEGKGERHSEVDRFAISKNHAPSNKTAKEENTFIFFSDSWSINGCCNNIRNYWIF